MHERTVYDVEKVHKGFALDEFLHNNGPLVEKFAEKLAEIYD
jgi:hypothetical protein